MFIITKTFTDDEGHLFTKVNPKQYSTPGEYCITDEDGNTVDSCSGFIGDDLEKNGMLNYICDYIEKR